MYTIFVYDPIKSKLSPNVFANIYTLNMCCYVLIFLVYFYVDLYVTPDGHRCKDSF